MNEMNQKNEAAETEKRQQGIETGFESSEGLDFELEQALKNFKSSMHAWSEAAYSRPRSVAPTLRQRSWRLAAGWALGCVLVAGSVSGGLVERHHRAEAVEQGLRVLHPVQLAPVEKRDDHLDLHLRRRAQKVPEKP